MTICQRCGTNQMYGRVLGNFGISPKISHSVASYTHKWLCWICIKDLEGLGYTVPYEEKKNDE